MVIWGGPHSGGRCAKAVQDQLCNVEHIRANETAFAALRADGSVVTWGRTRSGGDSSHVQDELKSVVQIQATRAAFAAIRTDGSVIAWGDDLCGGSCSSEVGAQLQQVRAIQASRLFWTNLCQLETAGKLRQPL